MTPKKPLRQTGLGGSWVIRILLDPLLWSLSLLVGLVFVLPHSQPVFSAWFPQLERPVYMQDPFSALLLSHLGLVAASSAASVVVGVALGIWMTRPIGQAFRPTLEVLVSMGQTFPPVAVLALAVPMVGFGAWPALLALFLYGLLPVVQAVVAGLEGLPPTTLQAARGLGMTRWQRFWHVEMPLAWPVWLFGIRTSVVINIGTAAIASTVGAKTLGTPIIVGLSGFNTAYVMQGAVLVALLAIAIDLSFERVIRRQAHRRPAAQNVS